MKPARKRRLVYSSTCTQLLRLWDSEHSLMCFGVTEESTAAAPVAALIELGFGSSRPTWLLALLSVAYGESKEKELA